MKKLVKKVKKWLVHKLGACTIEEIPPQKYTVINRPVECISLDIYIPNEVSEMLSEASRCDFAKLKIKESIRDFAIKVLPELMSYTTETKGLGQIVRCRLDIVPPINKISLVELLTEKRIERDKETRGI